MNKKRPKNLNLFTIKFPIPAIVSILHRVSGVFLFLLMPLLLWALSMSLASETDFNNLKEFLSTPFSKLVIWAFLAALSYHLVAGIRHLLMDIHIGEELKTGRLMAKVTLGVSAVLIVMLGVWLW
ncbi:MAG TPA: succinate dehydrogenase, cytochrome b556 subunit [Gammaproteobacteria bacterium]|nr:succinate dehydrogenase, cytochrome b556 subunit [Gammaproteobacteria bacterium]